MKGPDALLRAALSTALGEDRGGFARRELSRRVAVGRGRLRARLTDPEPAGPPVLLVGCPRSGTTLLFGLLQHHPDLVSLPDEGHAYWSAYNHPSRHGWRSDALSGADVAPGERRYLDAMLSGLGEGRPLDKTPKNVLRLPYLRALFPDATVVLVVRDGRATVASLLEAWRRRRGASYLLPERLRLADYDSRLWRYVLPPGWRDLQGTDLATVAARQYAACTEAATAGRGLVDAVVRYEDLVAGPVPVLTGLMAELGLEPHRAVLDRAEQLPTLTRGSLSAPRPDKWLDVAADLQPHLELIATRGAAWGYGHG